MKKLILFVLVISLISLTTCDILKDDDPCDKTAFKISGSLSLTVHVDWIDGRTNKPFTGSGLQSRVEFHKIACGFDEYKPGGDFTFTGFPNENGRFMSGTPNYNIRNSNDRIKIIISYNFDNKGWMQVSQTELTYSEKDFQSGSYSVGIFEVFTVL